MKRSMSLILFASCLLLSCGSVKTQKPDHNVGDIHFNADTDNSHFKLCDSTGIRSGRNSIRYENGQKGIEEACAKNFEFRDEFTSFTGYITVRFLVNCQLEMDRFRAQSMALDFSRKECPKELKEHIISMAKKLDNWALTSDDSEQTDFSKFINFKITNGKIENILL